MYRVLSPFEQFEIQSYVISDKEYLLTDTLLVSLIIVFFFQLTYIMKKFIRGYGFYYILSGMSWIYGFIFDLMESYLGEKGRLYFPFFFYLFLFLVFSNVIGMIPFSFTITSHLSITFSLSFIIWWGIVLLGFYYYGSRFFEFFYASGVPFRIVPFLVFIETISFIFRSISLALRLFANLVAGHILLDTISLFIYNIVNPLLSTIGTYFIGFIPIVLCLVLVCFEFIVAILQAYIFVILSVIYLKEIYTFH